MNKTVTRKKSPKNLLEVRPSHIAGLGAFAPSYIPSGERIVEYVGERITPAEADRRYNDDGVEHPHVLLFSVDSRTVIDAAVDGNEAQYINHSCEPNCIAIIDKKRIFIESIRDIEPGEELLYDYNLTREAVEDEDREKRYACHCGAPTCRGTMLAPKALKGTRKKTRSGA